MLQNMNFQIRCENDGELRVHFGDIDPAAEVAEWSTRHADSDLTLRAVQGRLVSLTVSNMKDLAPAANRGAGVSLSPQADGSLVVGLFPGANEQVEEILAPAENDLGVPFELGLDGKGRLMGVKVADALRTVNGAVAD